MNLRTVLAALRASWWLPILGLVLGGGAAVAVTLLTPPLYASHTQLFVSTTTSTSSSDALQGSQFSQQRVASYERLLTGDRLLGQVIDELRLDMSVPQLADEVVATAVPNTVLIDVTVTDPSPERAQRIAGAVGNTFTSLVTDIERPAGAATSPVKVTVIDKPDLPVTPSEPRRVRDLAIGLALGLVLGAGGAVARRALDRSVRDADELTRLTGSPVVGRILRDDGVAKKHLYRDARQARTAEDFRQLQTSLHFLDVDEPPKVLMVTSAVPGEGKTTVAVNLALAAAEAGQKVALIEADLRRPRVTRYLGLVGGVGLTNVLADTADFDDVVQAYGDGMLAVVASGPQPPNPGRLLASSHMRSLLSKLRVEHDLVVVDAPPVLPVADASGLAPSTDGVLLVVQYGSTRREQVEQAIGALERVRATVHGIVLNRVAPKTVGASAYDYDYGDEPRKRRRA